MKIPNTKTVLEAAVELRTSRDRIFQMIESGELEAVNVGKGKLKPRWAIPDSAIESLSKPKTVSVARKIPKHV